MSHQTTLTLSISAGHTLEFQLNSARLALEFNLQEFETKTWKDIDVAHFYIMHEGTLIKYFSPLILAVIDRCIEETVDLYGLDTTPDDEGHGMQPTDVMSLEIKHWG